jgi:hypothetical protein
MYSWYMGSFNTRTVVPSPLTIDFLSRSYDGNRASVKVKVKLEQGIPEGHVCHIVLWETGLSYGGRDYGYVERVTALSEALTITKAKDEQIIKRTFDLDAGWNKNNLGVSVFVQNLVGKEILNGRAVKLIPGVAVEPTSLGRVKALFN